MNFGIPGTQEIRIPGQARGNRTLDPMHLVFGSMLSCSRHFKKPGYNAHSQIKIWSRDPGYRC